MWRFEQPLANQTLAAARQHNVQTALQEDIGTGDLTAQLVPNHTTTAQLWIRESAVLCGRAWFEDCFLALDKSVQFNWHYTEGAKTTANTLVCTLTGTAHALLTGERAALNFLQTLSATATQVRQYVDALAQANLLHCAILDTRKTIPGLRLAQKYAITVGGGHNQRLALWDGILIKENHIAAAGGINAALSQAFLMAKTVLQQEQRDISIQIEVETLDQLKQALKAGAPSILLDNFSIELMKQAVEIKQAFVQTHTNTSAALLEASGGISFDDFLAVAATGVDRISIGRLTKDIKAIDFSLRLYG